MSEPIGVAVIGAGYWGRNLVRNFMASDEFVLVWLCDLDYGAAQRVLGKYSTVKVTSSVPEVLQDPAVQAVVITTPAASHRQLALDALAMGKHVLVEKPLADDVDGGRQIVDKAKECGLTLMVDRTYCYTPPVNYIRGLVRSGELGDFTYMDSVRINLGLVRRDVDVIWDLAPHDFAILTALLPKGVRPTAVTALGVDPLGIDHNYVAYLTVELSNGATAHIHDSWYSPIKVRTVMVGGSRRTVVWNDLDPNAPLSIYDSSPDLAPGVGVSEAPEGALTIPLRQGGMSAPALESTEALAKVVAEFARAIVSGDAPLTDGAAGLEVLQLLEAASRSAAEGGTRIEMEKL